MEEQTKQKMPVGMILILILVGWSALSILLTAKNAMFQIGPILTSGAVAVIATLIIVGILVSIFYGILKRFDWARKLAIGWYSFSIVLSWVNLVSFLGNKTMFDSYYAKILSPQQAAMMTPAIITGSLIFGISSACILGLIVIVYVSRKKDFFVN